MPYTLTCKMVPRDVRDWAWQHGYYTLEELSQLTEEQLLVLASPAKLRIVRQALRAHGLRFAEPVQT